MRHRHTQDKKYLHKLNTTLHHSFLFLRVKTGAARCWGRSEAGPAARRSVDRSVARRPRGSGARCAGGNAAGAPKAWAARWAGSSGRWVRPCTAEAPRRVSACTADAMRAVQRTGALAHSDGLAALMALMARTESTGPRGQQSQKQVRSRPARLTGACTRATSTTRTNCDGGILAAGRSSTRVALARSRPGMWTGASRRATSATRTSCADGRPAAVRSTARAAAAEAAARTPRPAGWADR